MKWSIYPANNRYLNEGLLYSVTEGIYSRQRNIQNVIFLEKWSIYDFITKNHIDNINGDTIIIYDNRYYPLVKYIMIVNKNIIAAYDKKDAIKVLKGIAPIHEIKHNGHLPIRSKSDVLTGSEFRALHLALKGIPASSEASHYKLTEKEVYAIRSRTFNKLGFKKAIEFLT